MALVRKVPKRTKTEGSKPKLGIVPNNQGDSGVNRSVDSTQLQNDCEPNQNSYFSPSYNRIASGRVHESLTLASIDKLTFVTKFLPPNYEELLAKAKPTFRGDGYTLVLDEERDICLWFTKDIGRGDFGGGGLRGSINPSKFKSAWELLSSIEQMLGTAGMSADVRRLDCAITFPEPFHEVFRGLDCGRKRSADHYRESPKGSSFYVGKKDQKHEMIVYDKSKQLVALERKKGKRLIRKQPPLTRIEKNSVPADGMKVRELSKVLEFEPFSNVIRYRVTFIEPPPGASRSIIERFYEFKALVERFGLWQAKRDLNKKYHGNFKRYFGEFYELEELQPTLDEIFQYGIRGFFAN